MVFDGRIDAHTLRGQGASGEPRADLQLQLEARGPVLKATRFAAPASLHNGSTFTRAGARGCAP